MKYLFIILAFSAGFLSCALWIYVVRGYWFGFIAFLRAVPVILLDAIDPTFPRFAGRKKSEEIALDECERSLS